MKKIYKSIPLLVILNCLALQWLIAQPALVNIDKSINGNLTFQATQKITLSAGFNYDSQGQNTFSAKTVPANGSTYNFTEPTDNSSLPINTTYPVGSIEGGWNVNSTGGASYSIPIKVVPGIQGIVPNLLIFYSSQTGEGLLGYGWNLSGQSKITRVGSDLYHETDIDVIHFDSRDHFALDGQRLIPVSTTSTYTEFRTEIESFSRIRAYGPIGDPTYFVLESKDGKTIEYGNTIDSRIEGEYVGGIIWNVNKISDKSGNYMTETYYENSQNGEYYPLTINYTGTTTRRPFNIIQFEYQARNTSVIAYASGCKLTSSSLLKDVNIKYENTVISQYTFAYNTDDRLTEVVEYGKNNTRINSTRVNWGVESSGTIESVSFTDPELTDRYQGDFDGDGKEDLVLVKNSKWTIYLSDGKGNFIPTYNGDMPLNSKLAYTGDFNGDGKKDLLVMRLEDGLYNGSLLVSTGMGFTTYDLNLFSGYESSTHYLVGNFMGNGKDYVLAYTPSTSGSQNYQLVGFNISGTTIRYDWADVGLLNWGTIVYTGMNNVPIDVNGDGKTDLMVIDGIGANFYEMVNGHLKRILPYNGRPDFNNTHNFLFGDFNGDGLTDIATYDNTGIWMVYISSGDGFGNPIKDLSFFNGFYTDPSLNNFYAQDIDGDGKCDLVCIGRGKSTTDPVKMYVNYSSGHNYFNNPTVSYLLYRNVGINDNYNHFGDYNGDGTIDFYYDDGSYGEMCTIFRGRSQQFVTSVQNGYNIYSGVTYKPITDNSVYVATRITSSYPLVDFQGPLYVVSSVSLDMIQNPQDVTNFTYNGARIHAKGKGFLGFQSVTAINTLFNTKVIDTYELNPTYFNVSLYRRSIYLGNDRSATFQATYTNSLIEYGSNRIFPYVSASQETNSLSGVTKSSAYIIDINGNPSSTTETFDDGSFNTTTYADYSSEGSWMLAKPQTVKLTKKHYADSDPFSLTTTYAYQTGTGRVLHSTTRSMTTFYEYFDNGNLKKTYQTDGYSNRVNHFEYDTTGRFVEKSYNALNHLTQYKYDDATGNVLTVTAPNTKVTSYTYDDFGRQTGIEYPTGQTASVSYEWATDLRPTGAIYYKLTTSPGLPSIKEYYDAYGRVLRTEKTGFDGTSIYASTVYNTKGQVVNSSLPYYEGQQALAKSFTYDNYGRLINDNGPAGVNNYTYNGKTNQVLTGAGQISSKTVDSQGNLISSTDESGTTSYTYKSLGKPGQITSNGAIVSMQYDSYGRQTQLNDPDAGITTYGYNMYDELSSQEDPNNKLTMFYGVLGRDSVRSGREGITTYTYDPEGNPGLLSAISYPGGSESYTYNTLGQLTQKTKTIIDGMKIYNTGYSYDDQGRITEIIYPSSFSVTNIYNTYGYLSEVRGTNDNFLIWTSKKSNAFGNVTECQFGNGLTTYKTYTNTGLLAGIQTSSVQSLGYNIDPGTGNLLSRSDLLQNLTETFTYDNLNRLTNVNGPSLLTMGYDNTGNITSKTGIGDYTYGSQPHTLTQVSNPQNLVSTTTQNITYTPFNKVDNISEGTASIQYTYGDRQRTISKYYNWGTLQKTTYYAGIYEEEISGDDRQLHYIAGGDGIAAIYVINNGKNYMYYVHPEIIGSLDVITKENGTAVQKNSFDAWGRRRNSSDWSYANLPAGYLFSRGYTGHEHMDAFNLINMNGRVYDPLLGRFLSPDNIVQDPGNSQSYNRYSYCLNNPFAYTDPSGYSWLSKIGDGITNLMNWLANEEDRFASWEYKNHISSSANYSTYINLGGQSSVSVSVIPGELGSSSSSIAYTPTYRDYPGVNFDPGTQHFDSNSGLYSSHGGSSGASSGASSLSPLSISFGGYSESPWTASSGLPFFGEIDIKNTPFPYNVDPPGNTSDMFTDFMDALPVVLIQGLSSVATRIFAEEGTNLVGDAASLARRLGKNTVTIEGEIPDLKVHYDLVGPSHKGVPTPHIQRSFMNINQKTGNMFWNKDNSWVRPMTQSDLDNLINYLKQLKK